MLPGAFEEETNAEYLKNEAVINLPAYQPIDPESSMDASGQNFAPAVQKTSGGQPTDVAARKPTREDDEIFMFAGFIRPGTHSFMVYDPVTKSYWKRDNIIVTPRDPSVKLVRPGGGFRPLHVPDEVLVSPAEQMAR